jgi:3',5'-cyclic-AMP phosphodiesterase
MKSSLRKSTSTLFLTDLHLDRTPQSEIDHIYNQIRATHSENVIITGDISDADHLALHLEQLAHACAPRPMYFVNGNHDYYGGSIKKVDQVVYEMCKSIKHLYHLDAQKVIKLADGIGLIGHNGWADVRAGLGMETSVDNPDRHCIDELKRLSQNETLIEMRALARRSNQQIRSILPLALTRFRHVVIATHVPPFYNAVYHKNRLASDLHVPHFCNQSLGFMILGVLKSFPYRRVTVLAGHTHSACHMTITRNLSIRVGASRNLGSIPLNVVRLSS